MKKCRFNICYELFMRLCIGKSCAIFSNWYIHCDVMEALLLILGRRCPSLELV